MIVPDEVKSKEITWDDIFVKYTKSNGEPKMKPPARCNTLSLSLIDNNEIFYLPLLL